MKFRNTFEVEVLARAFEVDELGQEGKPIIMKLELDMDDADNFINRFAGPAFQFGDYKVLYKFDNENRPVMITMFKDEKIYIIQSANQFINEVMRGYRTLSAIDAIIDITTFDFKAAISLQEPDEEDEKVEKKEFKPDDEGERFTAYQ